MGFVVVDIETTGLSKYLHGVTEIAAVKVEDNKIQQHFQTLVNPGHRIPSFITQLTGITNEMVSGAPKIGQVMPTFLEFLGNRPFVAHNATFDHGFLSHAAVTHNHAPIQNDRICTRKLASRLLPELPSKRLGMICEHFNIENREAHRALGDAHATAEVMLKFRDMLGQYNLGEIADIVKFQSMPKMKCNKLLLERRPLAPVPLL